jgi:hypothetical protein
MHQCKNRALWTLIAVGFLSLFSPSAFRQLEPFASTLTLLEVAYHRSQATSPPVLVSENSSHLGEDLFTQRRGR